MFPFGKDKGIRKPSLFGGFDGFFADFESDMARMFEGAQKGNGQHYVYGYRAYTGEDGKPVVEEFGNVPGFKPHSGLELAPTCGSLGCGTPASGTHAAEGGEVIEPYHDVITEGDKIKVIVEMPGVERDDIKVQSHGRYVSVKAESEHRKYAADIQAPDYVEAKPEKAQYKNGVLEITYAKADKPTEVNVE